MSKELAVNAFELAARGGQPAPETIRPLKVSYSGSYAWYSIMAPRPKAQDRSVAYQRMANDLRTQSLLQRSESAYRQVLRYQPNEPRAWEDLGSLLLSRGKVEEARDHFEVDLTLDKDSDNAPKGLTEAVRRSKR